MQAGTSNGHTQVVSRESVGIFLFFFRRSVFNRLRIDRPSIAHKKTTIFCAKNVTNYPSELGAFPSHFSRRMSLCPFKLRLLLKRFSPHFFLTKKTRIKKEILLLEKNTYVSKLQKLSSVSPLSNLFQRPFCSKGKSGLFPFKFGQNNSKKSN